MNVALKIILGLLSSIAVCIFAGENCQDLNGAWYNELGSEMIVTHTENGEFTGEYRTAVERDPGAAGDSYSLVKGKLIYICTLLQTRLFKAKASVNSA